MQWTQGNEIFYRWKIWSNLERTDRKPVMNSEQTPRNWRVNHEQTTRNHRRTPYTIQTVISLGVRWLSTEQPQKTGDVWTISHRWKIVSRHLEKADPICKAMTNPWRSGYAGQGVSGVIWRTSQIIRMDEQWITEHKTSLICHRNEPQRTADHVWSILVCCMPRNRSGKGRPVHILQGNKWVYWFVC